MVYLHITGYGFLLRLVDGVQKKLLQLSKLEKGMVGYLPAVFFFNFFLFIFFINFFNNRFLLSHCQHLACAFVVYTGHPILTLNSFLDMF